MLWTLHFPGGTPTRLVGSGRVGIEPDLLGEIEGVLRVVSGRESPKVWKRVRVGEVGTL